MSEAVSLNLKYNKMSIFKDVCVYSALATTLIAFFYGCMMAAEYSGLPAWAGLSVPFPLEIYSIYRRLNQRSLVYLLTSFVVSFSIMAFIYYAPFGLFFAVAMAIFYIAVATYSAVYNNIQRNSWRYLDYNIITQ